MELRLKYTAMLCKFLTKTGSRAQIGICGYARKQITEQKKMRNFANELQYRGLVTKVLEYPHRVLRGKYKQRFYVYDMARMLKGLLAELLFGDIGAEYRHMSETITQR